MAKIKVLSTLPTGQIFQLGDGREVLIMPQHRSHVDPSVQLPGETELEDTDWTEIGKTYKDAPMLKSGKIFRKGAKSQDESQASDTQGLENGLNPNDLLTNPGKKPGK